LVSFFKRKGDEKATPITEPKKTILGTPEPTTKSTLPGEEDLDQAQQFGESRKERAEDKEEKQIKIKRQAGSGSEKIMGSVMIIGLVIIAVVVLVFYEEVSAGFASFQSDAQTQVIQKELEITPTPGQITCDLIITIFGEIEHKLFSLPTILRFEFGDEGGLFGISTNHPEVATWQFDCGFSQIASFLPRLPTYLQIISENAPTKITNEQFQALNLSPQELQSLDLVNLASTTYKMKLKIIDADNPIKFRECGTLYPDLCRTVILPAGVVPEPFAFQKTFIIKDLPKQDYNIEITIEGQIINDLAANEPYLYLLRN